MLGLEEGEKDCRLRGENGRDQLDRALQRPERICDRRTGQKDHLLGYEANGTDENCRVFEFRGAYLSCCKPESLGGQRKREGLDGWMDGWIELIFLF